MRVLIIKTGESENGVSREAAAVLLVIVTDEKERLAGVRRSV
jgi:hypothetical protein